MAVHFTTGETDMGHRQLPRFALTVCAATCMAPLAARAADFYAGKTLALMINYAPGGPADTEGRIVARHLGKHIPGNPAIVIRNMPGAGGVIGANWLGTVAPPDGSTLGFLTGVTSKGAMADPNFKADMSKYAFIASASGITITFARTDIAPGLKKPEDILKAKDFWVGGLTADSDKDLRERMELEMLGVPHKYISGYGNTADARIALERNEIQYYAESSPSYRAFVEPGLVETGRAIALWSNSIDTPNGLARSPDADGIDAPTFEEFLIKAKGAPPKGILYESYRRISATGTTFLRFYAMAPGTPKEMTDAIRAGLVAMEKDPDFRDDAIRVMKVVPTLGVGEATEKAFRERLTANPEFIAFMRDYIAKGHAISGKK